MKELKIYLSKSYAGDKFVINLVRNYYQSENTLDNIKKIKGFENVSNIKFKSADSIS